MPEEAGKLRLRPSDAHIMTEAVVPRHGGAGLVIVKFPGVKVEQNRFVFMSVYAMDPPSDERKWQDTKIPTPPNGKVDSQEASCSHREFNEVSVTVPPY